MECGNGEGGKGGGGRRGFKVTKLDGEWWSRGVSRAGLELGGRMGLRRWSGDEKEREREREREGGGVERRRDG